MALITKQTAAQKRAEILAQQQAAKAAAAKKRADAAAAAKAAKEAKKANAVTPVLSIAQAKQETTNYLDAITKIQSDQATAYQTELANQRTAYQEQLTSQSKFLEDQIASLTAQSNLQMRNYETLLARITSQQQTELESMRQAFNEQNIRSESLITNLQSEIERLSKPIKPPVIDVETGPAVVGINPATQQSRKRQAMGTRGGRMAQQTTGNLGLAVGA